MYWNQVFPPPSSPETGSLVLRKVVTLWLYWDSGVKSAGNGQWWASAGSRQGGARTRKKRYRQVVEVRGMRERRGLRAVVGWLRVGRRSIHVQCRSPVARNTAIDPSTLPFPRVDSLSPRLSAPAAVQLLNGRHSLLRSFYSRQSPAFNEHTYIASWLVLLSTAPDTTAY